MMLTPAQKSLQYATRLVTRYKLDQFPQDYDFRVIGASPVKIGSSTVYLDEAEKNDEPFSLRSQVNDWFSKSKTKVLVRSDEKNSEIPVGRSKVPPYFVEIMKKRRVNSTTYKEEDAAVVTKEMLYSGYKQTLICDGSKNTLTLKEKKLGAPAETTKFETQLYIPTLSEEKRRNAKFLEARSRLAQLQRSLSSAREAKDESKTSLFQNATQRLEEKIGLGARGMYSLKTRGNIDKRQNRGIHLKAFLKHVLKNPQAVRQTIEQSKLT